MDSSEYEALNKKLKTIDSCKSWKDKTFFVMNQFPDKKANLDAIKGKIGQFVQNIYSDNDTAYKNELTVWEKNLLKIFSKHDCIFDTSNSKSIFYL
jgi:hypothetical protein